MKLPKFSEQYDKVITAYFKDEIKPLQDRFCFCGTLSPDDKWQHWFGFLNDRHATRYLEKYPYTYSEYKRMEHALLNGISRIEFLTNNPSEDALFNGMSEAIDVLRTIHVERGEIINEPVVEFKKRELCR